MPETKKKNFAPVAWLFYLVIGIEILYMISPFAIYYYSTYGPSLNLLHASGQTAWLSGFFLPHFVKTSSLVLNYYQIFGWTLILVGLTFFLIGAGQIYYNKFTKKGAVLSGLYKQIRHPQYLAFALMGLGLLLAWPRFTVLIMYITMLFVYYFLAKHEERECEEKFGESYKIYKAKTNRFFPGEKIFGRLPELPAQKFARFASILGIYCGAVICALMIAFALRSFSLSQTSIVYSENSATISAKSQPIEEVEQILEIALKDENVTSKIDRKQNSHYLNYVLPEEWYLPDVPIEEIPAQFHGHHQPKNYNRNKYKVLITKAKLRTGKKVTGDELIINTYGREPLVLAYVDLSVGKVTEIKTPPAHVRWGDIPTPLF